MKTSVTFGPSDHATKIKSFPSVRARTPVLDACTLNLVAGNSRFSALTIWPLAQIVLV